MISTVLGSGSPGGENLLITRPASSQTKTPLRGLSFLYDRFLSHTTRSGRDLTRYLTSPSTTREWTRTQMSPIILHQTTKSIFVAYSESKLTFEVNLPTNLVELTFKNTSKWVIDQIGVASVWKSWQ